MLKPFLKWPGGKSAIAAQIAKRLPKEIDTYYEPCLGAGGVFWHLASEPKPRFRRAMLSDSNEDLVATWQAVKLNPMLVGQKLTWLVENRFSEDGYYRTRHEFSMRNTTDAQSDTAARLIFLSHCGFNGLYRVNKAGAFNVPWGKYKSPAFPTEAQILAYSRRMWDLNVHIQHRSVWDMRWMVDDQSWNAVYFDPPYLPEDGKTSSFDAYTAERFGVRDHVRLADLFRDLSRRGQFVVSSNSDSWITRELYKGFRFQKISKQHSISGKASGRRVAKEVIIYA